MITEQKIAELKQETYEINLNARHSKAGVDSLMRQRDRLKAKKYLLYRLDSTQKDAEMKSKADSAIEEIDDKIDACELESGEAWAKLEAHRLEVELFRSLIVTKREELKQGL